MTEKTLDKETDSGSPPWLILDTGMLMTLLFADDEVRESFYRKERAGAVPDSVQQHQNWGMLHTLVDLQKAGVVRIAIPDMVLTEFLGLYAPVSKEHFKEIIMEGKDKHVVPVLPDGFSKRQERIAFLRELAKGGAGFQVIETTMGKQYLSAVQQCIADKCLEDPSLKNKLTQYYGQLLDLAITTKGVGRGVFENKYGQCPEDGFDVGALSPPQLVEHLFKVDSPLLKLAKASKLRRDAGEVSVADAVLSIQQQGGDKERLDIFIGYEGDDARAYIIHRYYNQTLENPVNPYDANDLGRRSNPLPDAQFNPNRKSFESNHVKKMEGVHFLTTFGFLNGLEEAATTQNDRYILGIEEPKQPRSLKAAYDREVIAKVRKYGVSRSYARLRDQPVVQTKYQERKANTSHNTGAWARYMRGQPKDVMQPILLRSHWQRQENRLLATMQKLYESAATIDSEVLDADVENNDALKDVIRTQKPSVETAAGGLDSFVEKLQSDRLGQTTGVSSFR